MKKGLTKETTQTAHADPPTHVQLRHLVPWLSDPRAGDMFVRDGCSHRSGLSVGFADNVMERKGKTHAIPNTAIHAKSFNTGMCRVKQQWQKQYRDVQLLYVEAVFSP